MKILNKKKSDLELFTYIDDSGYRSKTKCLLSPSPTDTWPSLTEKWGEVQS